MDPSADWLSKQLHKVAACIAFFGTFLFFAVVFRPSLSLPPAETNIGAPDKTNNPGNGSLQWRENMFRQYRRNVPTVCTA